MFYKILSTQTEKKRKIEKRVRKQLEGIKKQSLLFLLHPFLAKISKATTFNVLLTKQTALLIASRYSRDQNRSQYARCTEDNLHK
jgi:hypothetical protein